jgi:hypothetical protein
MWGLGLVKRWWWCQRREKWTRGVEWSSVGYVRREVGRRWWRVGTGRREKGNGRGVSLGERKGGGTPSVTKSRRVVERERARKEI